MNRFTSETAREAGKKSKRGPSKLNSSTRTLIFNLLKSNEEKFYQNLLELEPKQFVDTYVKLLPYVLAPRSKQTIEVSELSKEEVTELILELKV